MILGTKEVKSKGSHMGFILLRKLLATNVFMNLKRAYVFSRKTAKMSHRPCSAHLAAQPRLTSARGSAALCYRAPGQEQKELHDQLANELSFLP